MEEYVLEIVGQSADLKITPTASKDTGVFFPQDLLDFLGKEIGFEFRLHKSDFVNAFENIISSLPLYSNNGGKIVTHSNLYQECVRLVNMIESFFADDEEKKYIGKPFTLSETTRGRKYLYGLEQDGFSVRRFFIANNTVVKFQKQDDGTVDLRFETNMKNSTAISPLISHLDLRKVSSVAMKYIFPALRTKPFLLLAGISGTGKSRIVRELAFKSCPRIDELRKDPTTPGNYCMIEVKPNWHDSSELLGYYSNISKVYNYTKFVKFLVKAKQYPTVPFFICLDEMNLAPVEQYFAEFLSVLETRKCIDGDKKHIVTGALVDKKYFEKIYKVEDDKEIILNGNPSDRDWYEYFFKNNDGNTPDADYTSDDESEYGPKYTLKEGGVTLPENVFIIGTVNMDDTTHQFSRKVIDRAMTIEMNGGKLEDMFGNSKDLEYIDDPDNNDDFIEFDYLKSRYVSADEVLEEHPEWSETIKVTLPERLQEINDALESTPFQVSYRVLNELVIYLANIMIVNDGANITEMVDVAIDKILLMKILPRIEGDEEMFNFADGKEKEIGESKIKVQNKLELLKAIAPTIESEGDDKTYTAKDKLQEMINRLQTSSFTRYWP